MFFKKADKSMGDVKAKVVVTSILMILLVSIIPFFAIGIFSRPSADDYNYAVDTYHLVQSGNWNVFTLLEKAYDVDVHFYYSWQGLYSSAFLLALQPGIFGEEYYFLGAWALILLVFFSVFYMASQVVNAIGEIEKKYVVLFSLLMGAVLLQGMPCLTQGIYWFNGAWNYTFFFCMVLINVGLIIAYGYKKKTTVYLALITMLSFFISGGNHVTSFLNILLLIIAVLLLIRKKKGIILPLVTAVIGFMIVLRAPGTYLRQMNEAKQGLISTLIHSAWGCYQYLCEWMNVQWLFFLVSLVPVAVFIVRKTGINNKNLKIYPIFIAAVGLMLICGMLCVPFMAMGHFGEDRVKNVIWCTFMVCSAVIWIYFLLWSGCASYFDKIRVKWSYVLGVVVACFIVCFYGKANVWLVVDELVSGTAEEYAEACDERYELMKEAAYGEILYVDELPDAQILKFSDLKEDVSSWQNASWKAYYGVDMVVKD